MGLKRIQACSEPGSNDYINNFLQPFMADGTTYTHDQFIRLLVATLDRQLKARTNTRSPIYTSESRLSESICQNEHRSMMDAAAVRARRAEGGVQRAAPAGLHPVAARQVGQRGVHILVNSYAVQFNAAAKKLLDGMHAKLPGAQMALADCYSVVKELIDHPQRNGTVTSAAPAKPFRCVVVRA